jgi:hypothetical protein
MKKNILIILVLLPFFTVNAQFVNIGIMGGAGFGGLHGNGLKIKSGINPEFGVIFRYNYTEKVSIRSFVTIDIHKFTLSEGKQVDIDYSGPTYTIKDAPDYSIGNTGISQHVDFTYIVAEDKFDLSGGVFWSGRYSKVITDGEPRIFYGSTEAEILAQPNTPNVFETEFSDSHPSELYASDQIQKSLRGVTGGIYFAATGGTEAFKVMLRYDLSLKNYYSKFSTSNKLGEGYLRLGVIYFFS